MMYFKLAMENVKNSYKDYIIYFITLILAVCVFYNFNAITSQSLIFKMNIYQKQSIDSLSKIIYYLSIFIALVFCSLIVYANNALIKKRKKEFGIYGTLGMSKFIISKILIYETLVIGIISLVLGLIIGIITSQGVSVFVSKVFNFDISKYKFIVSSDTIIKTILYFGIMFLLIMIFNVIVVSKNKLIDLIYASKKNENIVVRNSMISVSIFIISLCILGTAYYMAWKYIVTPKNIKLPYSVLLGGLGTFLFFFGLSGVMLFILKKNKNIYLKDLNIFVIKQLTNKINTNFISMALISLMIFLSIVILGVSVNAKYQLQKHLDISIPSDVKITISKMKNNKLPNAYKTLNKLNFKLKDSYTKDKLDMYDSNIKIYNLLNKYADKDLKKDLKEYIGNLRVIKLSQYNKLNKIYGNNKDIKLKENEVLLLANDKDKNNTLKRLKEDKNSIKIGNILYSIKEKSDFKDEGTLNTKEFYYNYIAIIPDLNDSKLNLNKDETTIYITASKKEKWLLEKDFMKLDKVLEEPGSNIQNKQGCYISAESRKQNYNKQQNSVGTILYMGLYLGFIFLIASSAMLSIQQLTEASDSVNRYKSLKRMGISDEMINNTIKSQILIHFIVPFTLAIIHTIAAMKILNKATNSGQINIVLGFNLTVAIVMTGILIVYILYLYCTYILYKNIIRDK